MMNIEFGMRPLTSHEEYDAIINALESYEDLDDFALAHIEKIKVFYILNKKFWKDWKKYVGFKSKGHFNISFIYRGKRKRLK